MGQDESGRAFDSGRVQLPPSPSRTYCACMSAVSCCWLPHPPPPPLSRCPHRSCASWMVHPPPPRAHTPSRTYRACQPSPGWWRASYRGRCRPEGTSGGCCAPAGGWGGRCSMVLTGGDTVLPTALHASQPLPPRSNTCSGAVAQGAPASLSLLTMNRASLNTRSSSRSDRQASTPLATAQLQTSLAACACAPFALSQAPWLHCTPTSSVAACPQRAAHLVGVQKGAGVQELAEPGHFHQQARAAQLLQGGEGGGQR